MSHPSQDVPAATQVLIAGGGPVGLAAAVELGRRGIDHVVIEPRPDVSHSRPRCKTVNVRSLEHLRRWGIADRLRARSPLPVTWSQDIVFCTSLAGYELSRFHGVLGLSPQGDRFPETGQQAPQYVLEELLREVVDELGRGRLVTGMRVVGVEQDEAGARATLADAGGTRRIITADYVLGCDGPRSAVRAAIGSAYAGEHALRPNFGMVFHAPGLWAQVRHGRAVQYWIVNRTAPALMGPIDLDGTWWIIAFDVDRATGERQGHRIVDGVAGGPTEATILSTDPWTARMQLVDRARRGRVFLAGDAAHLNPPFGGHGLNTGLSDAVDLGWKLAAVLEGWADPRLLDSYEPERRPVQTRVIAAAEANNRVLASDLIADDLEVDGPAGEGARRRAEASIQAAKHAEFHALDLVLDIAYEDSPAIPGDERPPPPGADGPRRSAVPGARLPHAWLAPGRSLYDELGEAMTLLVLADNLQADAESIVAAARDRNVPLKVLVLPASDLQRRFDAGLVLVRPDQHVAWRGDHAPADPVGLIDVVRGAGAHRRVR
ncbi:MAG: FAD-dependent monooxygenase [Solirubrobacteraceae bacterium]